MWVYDSAWNSVPSRYKHGKYYYWIFIMKQKNGKRTKDSQITTKGNITPYTNMEKADENSKESIKFVYN